MQQGNLLSCTLPCSGLHLATCTNTPYTILPLIIAFEQLLLEHMQVSQMLFAQSCLAWKCPICTLAIFTPDPRTFSSLRNLIFTQLHNCNFHCCTISFLPNCTFALVHISLTHKCSKLLKNFKSQAHAYPQSNCQCVFFDTFLQSLSTFYLSNRMPGSSTYKKKE